MDDNLDKNAPTKPASDSVSYSRNQSPTWNVFGKFFRLFSNRTTAIAGVLVLVLGLGAGIIAVQRSTEYRQQAAITPVSYTFGDSSSIKAGSPNFDATSITGWLHNVSPGSNQIVLVNVSIKVNTITTQAPTVNSITYGGRQLTKLGSKTSDNRLLAFELWYLKNPPQGRNAVVVNVSRPSSIVAGAMTFSNVDQTNPFGQYLSYFGSGSVPPNLVYRPTTQGLTVGQGDVMVDAVTSYRIQRPCQYTAGPNQILTWGQGSNTTPLTGSYNQNGFSNDAAGSYARTPGYSDFMQWTITNCNDSSGGNIWIYHVTALKAAGSAPVATATVTPPATGVCTPSCATGETCDNGVCKISGGGSCTNGTIHGRVFTDTNENGTFDSGEQGFTLTSQPQVLTMWNNNSNLAQGANISAGNGLYQFTNVSTNTNGYRLRYTAPTGYRITTQPTAPLQTTYPYERTLSNGQYIINYSAIKLPPCDQTIDFGTTNVPAHLKGIVFIDDGSGGGIARNGIKETGEIGYSGATVRIPFGVPGTTVTTNSSGAYIFNNVYTISSYTTVSLILPSGYELTTPQGVNASPSSIDSLANGVTGNTVNFGIILTTTPPVTCTDGTAASTCKTTRPQYCPATGGTVVNNCGGSAGSPACGCPSGQTCNTSTGACATVVATATVTSPTDPLPCNASPTECGTCAYPQNVCSGAATQQCRFTTGSPNCTPTLGNQSCNTALPNCNAGLVCTSGQCVAPIGVTDPVGTGTRLALTLGLDGIGNAGDSTNRTELSTQFRNPVHPTVPITITVYNNEETTVITTKTGTITYQASPGSELYTGAFDLNNIAVDTNYTVKVKVDGHLIRRIRGSMRFDSANQTFNAPIENMIAGDINMDNRLSVDDYTILVACLSTSNGACTAENRLRADLNDDGAIDILDDFNLFRRELKVKEGD